MKLITNKEQELEKSLALCSFVLEKIYLTYNYIDYNAELCAASTKLADIINNTSELFLFKMLKTNSLLNIELEKIIENLTSIILMIPNCIERTKMRENLLIICNKIIYIEYDPKVKKLWNLK